MDSRNAKSKFDFGSGSSNVTPGVSSSSATSASIAAVGSSSQLIHWESSENDDEEEETTIPNVSAAPSGEKRKKQQVEEEDAYGAADEEKEGDDCSIPLQTKRPRPSASRGLEFGPSQLILAASQPEDMRGGGSSSSLFSQVIRDSPVKGDSSNIESVKSSAEDGIMGPQLPAKSESAADHAMEEEDDDESFHPKSSGKKRTRNKFGLAAKLDLVLRQQESDLALKEHLRSLSSSSAPADGLRMTVHSVTDEIFWKILHCHDMMRQRTVRVLVKNADFCEFMITGAEVMVLTPFHVMEHGGPNHVTLFGARRVDVLDRALAIPPLPPVVLKCWNCPCIQKEQKIEEYNLLDSQR